MSKLKKRILICGGRDVCNAQAVYAKLNSLKKYFDPNFVIIEGGSRGADRLGHEWGKSLGRPVITVDAPWDFYKNAAGPIRNQWMLDFCTPDLVIAFEGGRGTQNMIAKTKLAGIDIVEVSL